MTVLKTQPSRKPTRKMFGVIIATFVVHGFLGVAEYFYPGIKAVLPYEEWITALVPIIVGYQVRDAA